MKTNTNQETGIMNFVSEQFGEVRVTIRDGETWFVAVNMCRELEIGKPSQALARLDEDEKNTITLNEGIPGNPVKSIVNEPGLDSLVLGSRKPEARAFKRWITHDVLPSIRKTGGYIAGEECLSDNELLCRAFA